MQALDIYLSNVDDSKYLEIKEKLEEENATFMPLIAWDFYQNNYKNQLQQIKKRLEIEIINTFSKKYNWTSNITKTLQSKDYEAIIITDKEQKIIWVNDGFTSMTGYSKTYALKKTPRFLQGRKTSEETRKRIKKKLQLDVPFKETILNHRKDNSVYKCEVNIYPLKNKNTTHYIALEKKVI